MSSTCSAVDRASLDALDRVTKITDALQQITRFGYDAKGNLHTVTDPLNHQTTIGYNRFGPPLSVKRPTAAGPSTSFIRNTHEPFVPVSTWRRAVAPHHHAGKR